MSTIIDDFKEQIATLRSMDDHEILYEWILDRGKALQKSPLSEACRTEGNRVSRCQYQLFVAEENGAYNAWSDGLIASGYASILVDIFNQLEHDAACSITPQEIADALNIHDILSMNRGNGFYQMIDILVSKEKQRKR